MNIKNSVCIVGTSFCLFIATHTVLATVEGNVSPQTTVNTQVLSCGGTGTSCNFSLNAVGDLKDMQITVKVNQLGKITTPHKMNIRMPRLSGQIVYSLIPTESYSVDLLNKEQKNNQSYFEDDLYVNKPLEVLFASNRPDNDTLKTDSNAQSVVHIYRRALDETLWNLIGTVIIDSDTPDIVAATIIIYPNGTVEFVHKNKLKSVSLTNIQ